MPISSRLSAKVLLHPAVDRKKKQNRRRIVLICPLVAAACMVLLLASNTALAQGTTPQRGFTPNGSYALTDLETINTQNGNMMLRIPIASLPPTRGGMTAKLFLIYNSKLWDSRLMINPNPPPLTGGYTRNVVEPSGEGGWRYGFLYRLRLVNRNETDEASDDVMCPENDPAGTTKSKYRWKLKMSFPDGAVREFRPSGFGESDLNDGFFNIDPNGVTTECDGPHTVVTNGMTYYTNDGTYMRLVVAHDGDTNPYNNTTWTLYMPDGTRVTSVTTDPGGTQQRIYDRNENYIDIGNVTINGQPKYGIADQLGRGIAFGQSNGDDVFTVSGVGGETLNTTVKWKDVWVQQRYLSTIDAPATIDQYSYIDEALRSVDQITLPAQSGQLTYKFSYYGSSTHPAPATYPNGLGELRSLTLPTGAQATYTFLEQAPDAQAFVDNYPGSKKLTYRPEYDGVAVSNEPCSQYELNVGNCVEENWEYGINVGGNGVGTVTAPDGGVTSDFSNGGNSYKTIRSDGTVIERSWQNNRPSPLAGQNPNPYVKTEFVSIPNASGALVKTAIKDYSYDKNGNVTRVAEYDWVEYSSVHNSNNPNWSVARPTPLRVTTTSYYNGTPEASSNDYSDPDSYDKTTAQRLLQLPAATEVRNDSQPFSRQEFDYDSTSDGQTKKGNLTEVRTWDSSKDVYSETLTPGNSISVKTQYNQFGSPILTTDAEGNQTHITYGPVGGFSDLYPTQIEIAYGTSIERTETKEYDFYTGVTKRVTDVENAVTTKTDYDVFSRPILVTAAQGTDAETNTIIEYSDVARRVITRSAQTLANDGKLVTIQHFDQMGRLRLSRQLENSSQDPTIETHGIKVQTRYKYSEDHHSYQLSSHPYREDYSSQAPATSMDWNRAKTDNGGRLLEVRKFSGNSLPAPWGNNQGSAGRVMTTYDAEFTTVTDQANRVRRSKADGLGRLVRVDEPDANGNLGDVDQPNQPTSYSYDAAGNLRRVSQGSQQRFFMYDSVGRLIRARNPEQGNFTPTDTLGGFPALTDGTSGVTNSEWSMGYVYDANGNLTKRRDARDIVAVYKYDALNRNFEIDYSNTTINPDITRVYDNPAEYKNGKGRLWYSYSGGNESSGPVVDQTIIDSYDALGRPLIQRQRFKTAGIWGPDYQVIRTYDRSGNVKTQQYPSDNSVSYNYDTAGRLADKDDQNPAFSGNLGDGYTRTYSRGISYSPFGSMSQEQFGTQTALYHKLAYTPSGQLAEIRVSTSPNDDSWNRGKIVNDYSLQCSGAACNATDNNGNLRKQHMFIPTNEQNTSSTYWYQQYDYDHLNRLQETREHDSNNALLWRQKYAYDRYGNRTIDAATSDGINKQAFEIETATNRLLATGDSALTGANLPQRKMRYDAAGNLTNDHWSSYGSSTPGAVTRTYDAENKMTSALDSSGGTSYYTYNADGQRVRRKTGNVETFQIYGFDGELLAEYEAGDDPDDPQKEYGYRNGQLLITAEPGPTFAGSPYNGTPAPIPGKIELEHYDLGGAEVAYHDTTSGTHGQDYDQPPSYPPPSFRQATDVDIYKETAGYSNGYLIVGQAGEWLNYSVDIAATGAYTLTAQVAWGGVTGGTFHVEVDGVNKTGPIQIPNSGWLFTTVTKSGIELTAGQHLLRVVWDTNATNGFTGDIDYLNFTAGGSSNPLTVANPSFESPALGGAFYQYNPGGGSWTFAGQSGVTGNGSDFTYSNPAAPQGVQVAFLQGGVWSVISQSVSGFQAGSSYTVSFKTAQRGIYQPGPQSLDVFLDDVLIGTFYPSGTSYTELSTAPFQTSAGSHVLKFVGKDATGANTAFIDDVKVLGTSSPPPPPPPPSSNIHWLVTDHLGTPRMVIDQTGSLNGVKRHDYLPFGEELGLVAGQGPRTTDRGYRVEDEVRQKFTSKERDSETGLDYFGARYHASTLGRFTTGDPLMSSGTVQNPQSWNRYSYVLNRPLELTDPLGLFVFDDSVTAEQREAFRAGLAKAQENLNFIAQEYGTDSEAYQNARRAVRSYGSEGVQNGVTILATTDPKASPGATQVEGVKRQTSEENPNGQNIRITIRSDSFQGGGLNQLISHEGSHAADGSAWVASGFAKSKNPTTYRTEFDAYTVSSIQTQANLLNSGSASHIIGGWHKDPGKNPWIPLIFTSWDSAWKEADRATMRANNINRLLERPEDVGGYDVTPSRQGKPAFTKGAVFPN